MAEIVNLRAARKRRRRADEDAEASANRARFGQGQADKKNQKQNHDLTARHLDAHLRDPAASGDDAG